ncbi:MAG: Uma2 family endonuclease [Hyphomonadaceae bacterium]|nr:Uma2 family endonuclease [Hyphomonadaceae bacterium]
MDGSTAPLRSNHRFTVDDVLRMIEAGILDEKARVELRGGELIDMPAEGARHSNVKSDLIVHVAAAIKGKYRMGADTPLRLSDHEWPEPDLFLTPFSVRPSEARGADALLVVEVADTSLAADLGENAALYAQHGVREYWVVDLVHSLIHVHRLAVDAYPPPVQLSANDLATPMLAPEAAVRLADIL